MHKYIYWRQDVPKQTNRFANVHLLVGYNQQTITDYQEMAQELRKTFPQATDSEIRCGEVRESVCVKGFTLISWNAYIPEGAYPEWHQTDKAPVYRW